MTYFAHPSWKVIAKLEIYCGIWSHQTRFKNYFIRFIFISLMISGLIAVLSRLKKEWGVNFGIATENICSIMLFVAILVKNIVASICNEKRQKIYEKVNDHFKTITDLQESFVLRKSTEDSMNTCIKYLIAHGVIFVIFFCLPVVKMVFQYLMNNNELEKIFPYYVDYTIFFDQEKYYALTIILILFKSICFGVMNCAFEFSFIMTVRHVCAIFEIVKIRLQEAAGFFEEFELNILDFTTADNKAYGLITKAIDLHNDAIEMVSLVDGTYTFVLFVILLESTFIFSGGLYLVLLNLNKIFTLLRYMILFIVLLIHFSVQFRHGQTIIDSSSAIFDACYNIKWYLASSKTRKLLLIIMSRSSQQSKITGGGFFVISMNMFVKESKEDEDESQASSLEEARELAIRMHDELRRTLLFMSCLQGLPGPPGKPILIPGEEDSQPDVVGIRWERSSSNGGSAIIGYHVEHRKMGTPHWVRSAPVLCTFPELTLSGLEPGWRYQFRIRAQNALGLSEPSELSDPLTVTLQRTTSLAPRFDRDLKDCVVLEGLQAEFSVVYDGTPLPKISWFKDGFEIFSSRRTTITTDSNTSTLLIHTTSMDDEGEIKCSATNRAGHISTRAKLIIEAPPHVRLPRQYDEGLLFEQGETIRLKATNGGRPPPSITWYHNGEIIIVDSRHHFESITDNETILKITDAKRDDRGEYSIRAINKLGEDVASFLVTVTDRPAAPGKAIVTGTLGRSVTLAWQEPEDDGGCKIGTYIVEYYRLGWDVWLKAATSRQTTATLNDLIEGSEYRFRVKAENPYGLSDPSEESDIVFVPDPKRGITEPNMRAKSASQRDIPRGRSERREVSFRDASTPRTRSLTREEASNREAMAAYERTVSNQRLGIPGQLQPSVRPSRADSRVTFALDTASSENRRQWSKEMLPQPGEFEILGRSITQTAVVITPSFNDSGGERSYLESRSRSVSYSREHSPSPLELEEMTERAIQERVESMNLRSHLSPPRTPRRRRSSSEVREAHASLRSLRRDDEENMLHGSSEFMLVLYPGAEDGKQHQATRMEKEKEVAARRNSQAKNITVDRSQIHHSTAHAPGESEDEDLVAPPPTSFSLPELFSMEHQIIEILREAVSSTELLHERAMERFYKAVEAEKSAEKMKPPPDATSTEHYPLFNPRTRPVRRRLSNSGGTAWQSRRDRRRTSEGQVKPPSSLKIPDIYEPLQNVSSDPNLPTSDEALAQKNLDAWTDNMTSFRDSAERLKRWHETGIDLSQQRNVADMIDKEKEQINNEREEQLKIPELHIKTPIMVEEVYDEVAPDTGEILAEDSIETSGVSSEGESSDSEDLKKLKARIMAIPAVEEEDTYNPRGRMITNLDLPDIPPPVPPHRVPLNDIVTPPATPDRTNLSPTNLTPASSNSAIVPKSILKKRTDNEPIIVNQFGRPVPPEKPIKPTIPVSEEYEGLNTSYKSLSNLNYINLDEVTANENYPPTPTPVPSPESVISPAPSSPIPSSPVASTLDIDREKEAVISAGEAAVIKRRQMRQGSKQLSTEEVEEEQKEERMAVVSHYTEIVKQYSNPEYRQRSLSRDREPVRRPSEPRVASPIRNQLTNQPNIQRERPSMVNQPSIQKERLPVTPGKIVTPIPPMIPLIPGAKIIEPIPPVMPTTPIQRAKPIDPAEQRLRHKSRGNSTEPELRTRPRRQESTESRPSRKSSIADSRSTTPTRLRVDSRPSSRNESPMPRSRNVSRDRSRATSVSRTSKTSKSSRPSSRSSSKDRSRAATPTEEKLERLQKALDDKRDRMRRASTKDEAKVKEETERKVRSTFNYFIDVGLLLAALYVYLFKKEILAVPIIALLLFRYIQQELKGMMPNWWRRR